MPQAEKSIPSLAIEGGDDNKITEKEFDDFCEDLTDPMLKYIEKEEKRKHRYSKQSSTLAARYRHTYQNSYRMRPSGKFFFPLKVSGIIKSVLEESLKDKSYDYVVFSKLTSELSDRIKERVKEEVNLPRYKLVSFVMVGQTKEQGVRVGSRCLWNAKLDHYASSSYKNKSVFAVGVVYAAYFE